MPPLPRIHTQALVDLAEELRFAPRAAILRDIDRAEALAGELDPALQYPADWVVFRVTGYRPDMADPALIPGAALVADLSSLVERLCDAATLGVDDLGCAHTTADGLAERWSVSRKTLSRWRRRGLIARRLHAPDGSTRLIFTEQAAVAFASANGAALARASGFSRIDGATEAQMVARARRYRDLLGLSITQITERLAGRFGRSAEGVRQVLLRHDRDAASRGEAVIFGESGALGARAQRVIERAWRRGIEPGELVRRYGRTRAGIHRIINEQRLRRLVALDLGPVSPGARGLDEREIGEVLGAPALGAVGLVPTPGDMTELLVMMRARIVPVGVQERAWARAEQALRARASGLIAAMAGSHADAGPLDRAETDLRWADRLRAALAQTQLHLVLETLESTLGLELAHVRGQDALDVIVAGLAGLRAGLDAFDPWKSGRLAAPVGLMVSRVRPALAHREAGEGRQRAQVRILAGTRAPDWTLLVSPWAGAVRPDRRLAGARAAMDPGLASVLTERFGLDAGRARTLEEVAAANGTTIMQAGRLERRALRAGLAAARGG